MRQIKFVLIITILFLLLLSLLGWIHLRGQSNLFRFVQNKRWGYINKNGKVIIDPKFYEAGNFFAGMAKAKIDEFGKYGFIDTKGAWIISPEFDEAGDFMDKLAPVRLGRKWGFINSKGELIVKPQFESADNFHEGLALVENWSIIDLGLKYSNENAPSDTLFEIHRDLRELETIPREYTPISLSKTKMTDSEFGFIELSGKIVIKPKRALYIDNFHEGMAAFWATDKKWGYLNKHGEMQIPPQLSCGGQFTDGLAPIIDGDKMGFLNKKGIIVIRPQFVTVQEFSEGVASCSIYKMENSQKSELFGVINTAGEWVIPPDFQSISPFMNGRAFAITSDQNSGFMDRTGKMVLSFPRGSDVHFFKYENGITVMIEGKDFVYLDEYGKEIARFKIKNRQGNG
jgi:hypothetical protein